MRRIYGRKKMLAVAQAVTYEAVNVFRVNVGLDPLPREEEVAVDGYTHTMPFRLLE